MIQKKRVAYVYNWSVKCGSEWALTLKTPAVRCLFCRLVGICISFRSSRRCKRIANYADFFKVQLDN